jgi:transketolase
VRTTFIQTLTALAEQNPRIWLLCGDLGFSVLELFASRLPGRFINVGVAEQNMAGIAAGIALSGNTVFIYSIGNFPTLRCLEQLRNDVCYHKADVKIVAVGGGYAYGSQGYTHHAVEDVAVMSALPGLDIFVPCDPIEVREATSAIAASGRPAYLRLSRNGEPVLGGDTGERIGRPRYLRRGGDLVILAAGPIISACLAAAGLLAEKGVETSVLSVAQLKPLDDLFVRDLASHSYGIVTVEEHILHGGLYAMVAACLAGLVVRPTVLGLGIPEATGKITLAGDRDTLLRAAGLSAPAIAERVGNFVATL